MILLNLSNLEWVPERLKRNQAMFQTLLDQAASLEEGVYYNPPKLAGEGRRKYFGCQRTVIEETKTPKGKRVRVVQATYNLWHWYTKSGRALFAAGARDLLLTELLGGKPYVLWVNSAARLQAALAMQLRNHAKKMICDWSDDFRAPRFGMALPDLERLTAAADHLICVNETVANAFIHPAKIVVRNGTDVSQFQSWDPGFSLPPILPKPAGRVYIGFTGGLHTTRVDRQLLETLFKAYPKAEFIFVGYTDSPELAKWIRSFPNAIFMKEVPYSQLTHIIHSFNVAIVPHLDNEYTRGNDLLKVLEYLACGVPVVATPTSDLAAYGNAICIARTPEEFVGAIEKIIEGRHRHDPVHGLGIVQKRTWDAQVSVLLLHIDLSQ
jgi:glycosyltransferase involved in cell wall biosynthesis